MSKEHTSPFANAFAEALLDLAGDGQADAIGQELAELRKLVAENDTFKQYLADPSIGHETKGATVVKALSGQVSPLMSKFLGVVNLKGRLVDLAHIAEAYQQLLDAKHGRIDVDVTVATKLTDEVLGQVQQAVSKALGKTAVLHETIDESIIGGMIVRVEDKLIDASVKSQLAAMKRELLTQRR